MARSYRLTLALDDDLRDALLAKSEETERPVADVARDLLRSAFFGEEPDRPKSVGELAQSLLADGLTDEQVVERVLEAIPDASTTKKSVAWYRSDMKKRGLPVLSQVEAKRLQAEKG
jgi:plasmid stability protein